MLAGPDLALRLQKTGFVIVPGVISSDVTSRWSVQADEALRRASDRNSPLHQDFVATATSLRLAAADLLVTVHLALAPIWTLVEQLLGSGLVVSRQQAWIRRQYAPRRYPAGHAPHTWHQDGALHYDFAASQIPPPDALLPLVTCWLPLSRCGDVAPGLEILAQPVTSLCPLAELTDAALRARYTPSDFVAPVLAAGDAVLLASGTLHRTYVQPEMPQDRTSFELRYFADPPPARVGGGFIPCR